VVTQTLTSRRAWIWIFAGLLAGLALAFTFSGVQTAHTSAGTGNEHIVNSPNEVDFEAGGKRSKKHVWTYGSGFTPGQRVALLVADSRGALYEMTFCRVNDAGECDPKKRKDGGSLPVPLIVNDDGGFANDWLLGRFTRKNVGGEGMVTIWAMDYETFEPLASAPLALCNLSNREDGAEVPNFCSA